MGGIRGSRGERLGIQRRLKGGLENPGGEVGVALGTHWKLGGGGGTHVGLVGIRDGRWGGTHGERWGEGLDRTCTAQDGQRDTDETSDGHSGTRHVAK